MTKEIKLSEDTMIVSETNAKGIVVYANNDFCEIVGYSKDELIGKPHNYIRHEEMPKAAFKDLWQTVQSGNVWNGIVKNIRKNGEYYWVNATVYPSKTIDGELRYISVRVKPTEDEIENAVNLYKSMI